MIGILRKKTPVVSEFDKEQMEKMIKSICSVNKTETVVARDISPEMRQKLRKKEIEKIKENVGHLSIKADNIHVSKAKKVLG